MPYRKLDRTELPEGAGPDEETAGGATLAVPWLLGVTTAPAPAEEEEL